MLPTRYASFFKRFVAFVIDGIIAKLISAIIVIPLWLFTTGAGVLAGVSLHNIYDTKNVFEAMLAGLSVAAMIFWALIGAAIFWLYFALFESSHRQATPGKMILGLFVTDIHGQRITFGRAMGRTLSKILSKMFCMIGYIMALFTARNQALHDLIADTLVLEPDYPAPAIASPQATPPGQPVPPAPSGVAVPPAANPVSGSPENRMPKQELDTESTDNKPDGQSTGGNKHEQEKK